MSLRQVLSALRAAWWLPLLGLLLGGGSALGLTAMQTPMYTSNVQFFVATSGTTSTSEVFQGGQFSQQRVASYAELLRGEALAAETVERLGLDISTRELRERIGVGSAPETVLIDVSVDDPDPEQAQRIAAFIAEEFPRQVNRIEAPSADGRAPVRVTVSAEPEVPTVPTSPRPVRAVALGLAVGLVVGAGLALLRSVLDRTVKDPDDVTELVGAPVIGTVLRSDRIAKRHTFDRAGDDRTAEDYRQIRTNLQFLRVDEPPRTLMFSSALSAEGKTTLVVNLAVALAEAGQQVTVVEADLRRPRLTAYLGLVSGVGLTNLLAGTAEVDDVVQTYRPGLSVVGSGPLPPNPGELLGSTQMMSLMQKLRGRSDFVLVDAPPLLPVADAAGLAAATDGVVLSARYGRTRKDQLRQAGLTLERVGAPLLGVVLNLVPPRAEIASAHGYGNDYDYSALPTGKRHRRRR